MTASGISQPYFSPNFIYVASRWKDCYDVCIVMRPDSMKNQQMFKSSNKFGLKRTYFNQQSNMLN